jgi:hypothetical protein
MRSKHSAQDKLYREKMRDLNHKIQQSIQIFDKISNAVKSTVQTFIVDQEYPQALRILDRDNLMKASNDLSQFEKACNEHYWHKNSSYDASISKAYEKWSDLSRAKLMNVKRSEFPNQPEQWIFSAEDEKAIEYNASMRSDAELRAAGYPILLPEYQRRQYLISMIHSRNDKNIEDIVSNVESNTDSEQKSLAVIHARINAHLTSQSTSLKQQRSREMNFLVSTYQDEQYNDFGDINDSFTNERKTDNELFNAAFVAINNVNRYFNNKSPSQLEKRKGDILKFDKYGDDHPKKYSKKPYVYKWCDKCGSDASIKIKSLAHTHNTDECTVGQNNKQNNNQQTSSTITSPNHHNNHANKSHYTNSNKFLNTNLQRQTEKFLKFKQRANLVNTEDNYETNEDFIEEYANYHQEGDDVINDHDEDNNHLEQDDGDNN